MTEYKLSLYNEIKFKKEGEKKKERKREIIFNDFKIFILHI